MRDTFRLTCMVQLLVAAFATSEPAAAQELPAPEAATGRIEKTLVRARESMVVAAHPDATRAGLAMLEAGGSAVDAMIAVQLVLGLVEPQSSGLGGGAFLVHFDARNRKLSTLDGRETAPAAATPGLFIDAAGEPMEFFDAVVGGRSVGTPGLVALLAEAHARHGILPWPQLFEPAIKLARDGFVVSDRLNRLIAETAGTLFAREAARAYFLSEEAVPVFPGTLLRNEAYAQTLETIARDGADGFYRGEIARDVVAAVQGDPDNPGLLSLDDLENYRVIERDPTCVEWKSLSVCGMGPPSSGAVAVGQILKLTEPHGLDQLGPADPQAWRLIGDATRLAFADRGLFLADPDFVKIPAGLLDPAYLESRSRLLAGERALGADEAIPGDPPMDHTFDYSPGATLELPSTSHISIVDRFGNALSMTTTIENGFGSRLMVRGFLLNNQLTDFSFEPEASGKPVANRVEAGKRPRSSMAPTIVLRDGKPVFVVGSPGGSQIIPYVAQALIGHFEWGLDAQQAVSQPHLSNRFGTFDLEAGTQAEALAPALSDLGYRVRAGELNSGLHAIAIGADGLQGGADPRRDGLAMGR